MRVRWCRVPRSRSGSSVASSPGSTRIPWSRVLEIGTGGGAIAIACAMAFPGATIDAVDVSHTALALAHENCAAHGVADRVRLSRSDVYSEVRGRYDLIVGNPPYVDAATMASLDPEYRHEPRIGLEAGADGLDCVRRILAGAGKRLRPGGVLVCEVGASRAVLERDLSRNRIHLAGTRTGWRGRLPADRGAGSGSPPPRSPLTPIVSFLPGPALAPARREDILPHSPRRLDVDDPHDERIV